MRPLIPSGFVWIGAATYKAMAEREHIGCGKDVIVTGFTSQHLIVRALETNEDPNMPLQPCRECKKEISSEAKVCPHCGLGRPGQSDVRRAIIGLYWYKGQPPFSVFAFGWIGAGLVVATLVVAASAWAYPDYWRPWLYLLAAIWAVVPPLWFWFEYHHYILNPDIGDISKLEEYKYGVQLGAAIWAGVALSLAAYISSDHIKKESAGQGAKTNMVGKSDAESAKEKTPGK